jgi:hypothetical protein
VVVVRKSHDVIKKTVKMTRRVHVAVVVVVEVVTAIVVMDSEQKVGASLAVVVDVSPAARAVTKTTVVVAQIVAANRVRAHLRSKKACAVCV